MPEREQRQLGDFELLRELGRGGMGIVGQVSLNREIALKALASGLWISPFARRWVRRGAGAAARKLGYRRSRSGASAQNVRLVSVTAVVVTVLCSLTHVTAEHNADGPPRQSDPNAPHRDGVLDYSPFRLVGHADPEPGSTDRRWGDLWGYEYDGGDPDLVGTVYVYVGVDVSGTGVAIFDITDPTKPVRVGTYAPPGQGGLALRDVEVYDGIAYFSSNNGGGVHIVDVRADPVAPPLLKRVTSADGGINGVHRLNVDVTDNGTFLYEAGRGAGVAVFDVSDARNPSSIRPVVHINEEAHDALARNGRLYISRGSTMPIYDVTNIQAGEATLLARFSSGSGTHGSYPNPSGKYVFIGHEGGTRDLRVYDLRDVAHVTEVVSGRITNADLNAGRLSNVHNQFVLDDLLFNAWSEAGLAVHDISDPRTPRLVGTFDTDATHTRASFEGAFGVHPGLGLERVLVSDRESGLWIVNITREGDFDRDGDVDLADSLALQQCLGGPGVPSFAGCERFDFDADNDVDLADLVAFQAAFTGAR